MMTGTSPLEHGVLDFVQFDPATGMKQPITNFYEIRRQTASPEVTDATTAVPAAAPPELRQRRFVLFVDSTTVHARSKKPVLESVQNVIDKHLQAEDQMMIVAWRSSLQVITPFTNDREVLKRGIGTLAHLAPSAATSGSSGRSRML
jgi:hypothetical protein